MSVEPSPDAFERSVHQPVLGSILELQVTVAAGSDAAETQARLAAVEEAVLDEFDRLEQVYSAYAPSSELSVWRAGAPGPAPCSADLAALLALAAQWCALGRGAFNPAVDVLTQRWCAAEREGVEPAAEELARLSASIASLPYAHDGHGLTRTGDCSPLTFNAIAKGLIVDRAIDAAMRLGWVRRLVVNAGGDLAHNGAGELVVGVEDPFHPADDAAPVARVRIGNQAAATSGGAHRGFSVGGRRHSHVIDPRTGRPVAHVAGATVVASSAAVADAAVTLLSVLEPDDGLALLADVSSVLASGAPLAGCVFAADGRCITNTAWDALAVQ